MYEIIENLYIGDAADAHDLYYIENIDCIINCTHNVPFAINLNETTQIQVRIQILDLPEYNDVMFETFKTYIAFIDLQLSLNKTVFVHCVMGRQRSAAIIAAYLIYKFKLTKDEAIIYIKSKKTDAFQDHVTFEIALDIWQSMHIN